MRENLICVIVLTCCVGVTMLLSPEGRLKKYVSLSCSLCVVAVLFTFLPGGDIEFDIASPVTVSDSSKQVREEIIQRTIDGICAGIKKDLMSRYKIDEGDISVRCNYTDGEEIEIDGYYIELCGAGNILKTSRIQYHVSENYGAECTVVYIE